MARRNPVRSWLAASLIALSGAAGGLALTAVPAAPAGAVDNNYVDVTVLDTAFNPSTVYARPGDIVRFTLGTNVSTDHTVTLEVGTCNGRPNQLCERTFDDAHRTVFFRFSAADSYPYFDRIARDDRHVDMRGTIVVTDQPPVTTSTEPPRPATTTTTAAQATTTTTAGDIHPFVVYDPGPSPSTTTTTAPAHLTVINTAPAAGKPATAASAAAADSAKGKAKGASGPSTTTTTAPPAAPDESVFSAASLIPTPESPPAAAVPDADTPVDDVTSTAADLLHTDHGDDGTRLMVVAVAALAAFLLGAGSIAWCRRSSRYFPA